jgi:CobQ-like glutamine amidotransferase family enzyme
MSQIPVTPAPETKKSNQGMIIAIVVVVVLCCCCITALGGWYLWNNGDKLLGTGSLLLLNFA